MTATKTRRQAPVKTIDDPIRFLFDTGIAWYMNRFIFHPFGLIFMGAENPKTRKMEPMIIDRRTSADAVFTEAENAKGYRKYRLFLKGEGGASMKKREQIRGYTVQPLPELTNG